MNGRLGVFHSAACCRCSQLITMSPSRTVEAPGVVRGEGGVLGLVGEEGVELGVALVDAGLHARRQPCVAALEAVDE